MSSSAVKTGMGNMAKASACLLLRASLSLFYAPLKLFPAKRGKMLFLSRQTNSPSVDAELLFDELKKRDSSLEIICICKRVDVGFLNRVRFAGCLLKSLYHLSTAQVCVLDSYWPAVSILKHKKTLKVVQMWHALGKIKRSGWQTIGLPGGRNATVSRLMKMHEGYDFVIAGAPSWNPFYCASFGVSESVIRNVGLPRIDYMIRERGRLRESVIRRHPMLRERPVVLYAPTFRRGLLDSGAAFANALLASLDFSRYAVIVKAHPNQKLSLKAFDVVECSGFSALELLSVAEYLVTDYSAIALEAAALGVKTLYYVPDYDEYRLLNGLNVDLFEIMPGCVYADPSDVASAMRRPYPQSSLDAYRRKYLPETLGASAKAVADVVVFEAGLSCGVSPWAEDVTCAEC